MFKAAIYQAFLMLLLAGPGSAFAASPTQDLARVRQMSQTQCSACHGTDGNSPLALTPRLAGQHPEYLVRQMHDFRPRDGKPAQRENSAMEGISTALAEADIQTLAVYFSVQKPLTGGTQSDSSIGRRIWKTGIPASNVPACAACHGPTGAGIPPQYPRLRSQNADYAANQMKAFGLGMRHNDSKRMMFSIARPMTEAEIQLVSRHIAAQH